MQLIIGLGNPGKQYERTRHNAGFLALDFLREYFHFETFHQENRFQCELAVGTVSGHKLILVKPTTFMNRSGVTVRSLLDFYKLTLTDIIIIHDDIDLAPGTLKVTSSSRAAGHNGVQHIIETFGTQDFTRIRLGVGRSTETEGVCRPIHDYVLDAFTDAELTALKALFDTLPDFIVPALPALSSEA